MHDLDRLASGPHCTVEKCGCGTIHLNVGPVTMRLDREMISALHTVLGEALIALEQKKGLPSGRRPELRS